MIEEFTIEKLAFTKQDEEKFLEYLKSKRAKEILAMLNVYDGSKSLEENIESIKKYVCKTLSGEFIGKTALDNFLNSMDYYIENDDFKRFYGDEYIPDGFIDYNISLRTKKVIKGGHTLPIVILGPDKKEYFVKEAQGPIRDLSGIKHATEAKYNPTIASAIFEFLGEEAAKYTPGCKKPPYYYIYSENFLKPNQKSYTLLDEEFMKGSLNVNDKNDIKYNTIMKAIEETIRKNYGEEFTEEQMNAIIDKLKLQYATQITLKKLIFDVDRNLGNISVVITENEEGKVEDINISPAYDFDLSFLVGEELEHKEEIKRSYAQNKTDDKNIATDLKSVMQEFKFLVPGYQEKMNRLVDKFSGNYLDQIFDMACKISGVELFGEKRIKDKFGGFIMRRVALFKEACKGEQSKTKEI